MSRQPKYHMTRTIPARPRNIQGIGTTYYDLDRGDEAWMMSWLITMLAQVTERAHSDAALREAWFGGTTEWPRRRGGGTNSDASMLAGIVNQVMTGRNLTDSQLSAVETLFDTMAPMFEDQPDWQPVRFQKGLF